MISLLLSLLLTTQLDPLPVGSRLSLEIEGERRVTLQAKGPSVLWIRASAPGITMLRIVAGDIVSSAPAVNGVAECVIPIYGNENVSAIINATADQKNVLLLSFYGIGEAVADPRGSLSLSPPLPMSLPVAAPILPVVLIAPQTPIEPTPILAAENDISTIPMSDFRTSIFFGQVQSGNIATSVPPGFVTFRLYVPNRQPFEVIATGNNNVRVMSEETGSDFGAFGKAAVKRIMIPGPSHGYYLISIQGSGAYSVQAQSAD